MHLEPEPRFWESGVNGPAPVLWYGGNAVDGDAYPWAMAPRGSIYCITGSQPRYFVKNENAGHDSDWSALGGLHTIVQRVAYTDFTDGGAAVGTKTLDGTIPAGAVVLKTAIVNVTGFAGDTSAVLIVGDGTDTDRYMTSTLDVFSDVAAIDGGAVSGTAVHTTAKTPVLTITSGSDWGLVSAGALTVKIFYLL